MRLAIAATLVLAAAPASAENAKETDCRYQAQVAAAVQKARMDGVPERGLAEAIAKTNPTWPERYNNAIPVLGGAVYQLKKHDLRVVNLGEQWMAMCMSQ
ncbi:MAG: hypothetical protein ACK5MY_10350 [Jhaorihella sp.]